MSQEAALEKAKKNKKTNKKTHTYIYTWENENYPWLLIYVNDYWQSNKNWIMQNRWEYMPKL